MDSSHSDYEYVDPQHYKEIAEGKSIADIMISTFGRDNYITFCYMNAFKYRMRLGKKPNEPVERDLRKALDYENQAKKLRRKRDQENKLSQWRKQKRKVHHEYITVNNGFNKKDSVNRTISKYNNSDLVKIDKKDKKCEYKGKYVTLEKSRTPRKWWLLKGIL